MKNKLTPSCHFHTNENQPSHNGTNGHLLVLVSTFLFLGSSLAYGDDSLKWIQDLSNQSNAKTAAASNTAIVVPSAALATDTGASKVTNTPAIPIGTQSTTAAPTIANTTTVATTAPNPTSTATPNAASASLKNTVTTAPLIVTTSNFVPQAPATPLIPDTDTSPLRLYVAAFGICLVGGIYLMVKGQKHLKNKHSHRPEGEVSIVSKVQIGPKRQIMVLRFRGEEILIASTESGVKTLSHAFHVSKKSKQAKAKVNNLLSESQAYTKFATDASELLTSKNKSQELTAALKKLNQYRVEKQPTAASAPLTERESSQRNFDNIDNLADMPAKATEPKIDGFKSFYKNQFQNEQQKIPEKKPSGETDFSLSHDVTNMIREKLKSMQTL